VGVPLKQIKLNATHLIMRRLTLCGSVVGSPTECREMLQLAADKERLAARRCVQSCSCLILVVQGIVPKIEEWPLEQVNQALTRVIKNEPRYRCVLTCKL
jgi:D-arabinose 1-dehydrogenase-like Zn-dependent alcohol dehydrogenase